MNFFHKFEDPRGLGCIALESIDEGELLLSVPFNECIWPSDSHEDPFAGLLRSISTNQGDHLKNIRESGSLDHLPVMEGLQSINLLSSLGNVFIALTSPYTDKFPRWVLALALSRCFDSESQNGTIAFVPYADQFNHSTRCWNTRIRETSDGAFCFYAETRIEKNSEILNNYGIESDIEMWVTHGFVDDGLTDSVIYLPLSFLRVEDSQQDDEAEDDPLMKIDVNCDEVIPREIRNLFILDDFLPKVCDALIRAMNRMLISDDLVIEGVSNPIARSLIQKDRRNCAKYRQRLVEFKANL